MKTKQGYHIHITDYAQPVGPRTLIIIAREEVCVCFEAAGRDEEVCIDLRSCVCVCACRPW